MPVLEKTCQDYVLNPTKERINLNELPVDTVVKNVSQEPTRKQTVDNAAKPGKFHYDIKVLIYFKFNYCNLTDKYVQFIIFISYY